ncbi:DnaA/Hda family protein [Sphingomicrobium sp. XHP0239]|uniref:HdaA/DnaA family protein n=1 Tax=Sphingomicrobium maritimum TaxID=3133972 RepID=UPI0031CCBD5D
MTRQIALPLSWPVAPAPGRFIAAEANAEARRHLERWNAWPVRASLLIGPRRSGRSLLAQAFVERTGGRLFDDAERHDEEELFHAWNRAQEEGRPLLLVADRAPPAWEAALPDLRTRLAITPVALIREPDDALFGELLALHFADRGLHLAPDVMRYLVERCERSYFNAERLVERIDRHAVASGSRLTIPTVRAALEARGEAAE